MSMTVKVQTTEGKINTWGYIQLQSFCPGEKTNNKVKRQLTEWETVFANSLSLIRDLITDI